MLQTRLPDFVREHYECTEWRHASAILSQDFPGEWHDILSVLTEFRLKKSWITEGGGQKSKVSGFIDSYLYARGWEECLICARSVWGSSLRAVTNCRRSLSRLDGDRPMGPRRRICRSFCRGSRGVAARAVRFWSLASQNGFTRKIYDICGGGSFGTAG